MKSGMNKAKYRIKQRAMYEGEPHELGIIFVQEQHKKSCLSAVNPVN